MGIFMWEEAVTIYVRLHIVGPPGSILHCTSYAGIVSDISVFQKIYMHIYLDEDGSQSDPGERHV